jgi:hypothetical protein
MLNRCLAFVIAAKHPGQLGDTFIRAQTRYANHGAAPRVRILRLLNEEMLVGKTRDLGKVRDAEHLPPRRKLLELLSDNRRRPPADP